MGFFWHVMRVQTWRPNVAEVKADPERDGIITGTAPPSTVSLQFELLTSFDLPPSFAVALPRENAAWQRRTTDSTVAK